MTFLVLGLARSGRAAALALAGRGVRVVAVDRSPDVDTRRRELRSVQRGIAVDGDDLHPSPCERERGGPPGARQAEHDGPPGDHSRNCR